MGLDWGAATTCVSVAGSGGWRSGFECSVMLGEARQGCLSECRYLEMGWRHDGI